MGVLGEQRFFFGHLPLKQIYGFKDEQSGALITNAFTKRQETMGHTLTLHQERHLQKEWRSSWKLEKFGSLPSWLSPRAP